MFSKRAAIFLTCCIIILLYHQYDLLGTQSESIFNLEEMDTRLWKYIQNNHLTPPSIEPYKLSAGANGHNTLYSSMVLKMLNQKRNGLFIEVGAYDGEGNSNTLALELLGWKGLLIECNPQLWDALRSKNRKAWIADVCLSPSTYPQLLTFFALVGYPGSSRIGRKLTDKEMETSGILSNLSNKTWINYQVKAFPLFSIIAATGELPEIDFLSLDIEGAELNVLRHFPFEKIVIKIMVIEVAHYNDQEQKEIKTLLDTKGYDLVYVHEKGWDYMFALRELNLKL